MNNSGLSIFQDNKIISCEKSISDYKLKDLIICTLIIDLENKFTMLEYREKDIILNQQIQKIDNTKLLFYFCYLKSRMYRRSKDDGDLTAHGGRAETCYPSFKTINAELDITDDTINKYNEILVKLNLIRVGNVGHWYYKEDKVKNLREGVNIYTLFKGHEETAQNNIKETIKLFKQLDVNANKVFTENKKYKNNNRRVNGYIGRIKYLQENGKATPEQIDKMNSLIELNSDKTEEIFKIKSLLEKYPDVTISNIYFILDKEEKGEYYEKIETESGLYDMNTDEFLVEKEYYDWVISNYSDDKKEFFENVVKKHKGLGKNKNKEAELNVHDNTFKSEEEFLDMYFGKCFISDEYSELVG
jgi:hypothetical protein